MADTYVKNKNRTINSVLLASLFALFIGADFFLHIFLPLIGFPFFEWNLEVAYGLFIPFAQSFERLSGITLLIATVFGLVQGFIYGYLLALIYNGIITKIHGIKR